MNNTWVTLAWILLLIAGIILERAGQKQISSVCLGVGICVLLAQELIPLVKAKVDEVKAKKIIRNNES